MAGGPVSEQRLADLVLLRRVRDRIDREYAQPLDVDALARGVHVSAGHLSREFKRAYGESPYAYLMTRRIERGMTLLRRGDLSVTEVCFAVGYEDMRWITVGPPGQPQTSVVLHPPAADPTITDDERRTVLELIAKGNYAALTLGTDDLDGTFGKIEASGAEVLQEPTDQDYGVRDCAFRDPTGNRIRINQLS
ncbi:helix-turn-helix domain-containing protein [Modestobacter sp. VKM Ac-2977]|uniref:helix-turn-helix domain-containing protein n=1 Tax=Modestobacter sp. VKM Ac-2977 TaxID=3004131 RepID=UPI0022AAF082|nr:helix-turn-helix domain-containing protein [Modestobacter sp. VKM Ac-2977]MCZ2820419.1 helix-turn-helix domain-containing protein [Modestobacter sp. VKM Ac-2977]